ncbi:MAG: DUF6714 family protein [Kofleriaceae bacterium]
MAAGSGDPAEVAAGLRAAFAADLGSPPRMTLRAGDAVDEYRAPPPLDPALDEPSDAYLARHPCGVGYLDPASWRHYLPHLLGYALRHLDAASPVTEAVLGSLRPPDRDPPRLASLDAEQEAAVTRCLEVLAFADGAACADLACQVLEEYWLPGARYRSPSR